MKEEREGLGWDGQKLTAARPLLPLPMAVTPDSLCVLQAVSPPFLPPFNSFPSDPHPPPFPCRPGDYLRPDEDELEGLSRRLDDRLQPVSSEPQSYGPSGEGRDQPEGQWEIGDCLASWWRPGFETFMYPYTPPHVTKPKECKKLFLVQMPPGSECEVPGEGNWEGRDRGEARREIDDADLPLRPRTNPREQKS